MLWQFPYASYVLHCLSSMSKKDAGCQECHHYFDIQHETGTIFWVLNFILALPQIFVPYPISCLGNVLKKSRNGYSDIKKWGKSGSNDGELIDCRRGDHRGRRQPVAEPWLRAVGGCLGPTRQHRQLFVRLFASYSFQVCFSWIFISHPLNVFHFHQWSYNQLLIFFPVFLRTRVKASRPSFWRTVL